MKSTGPDPTTRAALLEAMEERHVTVDRERKALPRPFFVIATRARSNGWNLSVAGSATVLLPAHLDQVSDEADRPMLQRFVADRRFVQLSPITGPESLSELIAIVRRIRIGEAVERYLISLIPGDARP
ncbi:MAG: AAA family ATPase [Thermomicrobiales bacterium]